MTELIINETRKAYVPLTRDDKVVVAQVGDRLIYMAPTGDEDVLEVILTRRKAVIARALTAATIVAGKKYEMPLEYVGGFPAPAASGQVSLYRKVAPPVTEAKPKRERAAKGETKLDKCRAIFAAAPAGATKADIVAKFVADANCTPAGANTYYLTLKKET